MKEQQRPQKNLSSTQTNPPNTQTLTSNSAASKDSRDYTHIFENIFRLTENMFTQTQDIAHSFCQIVMTATQGQAQLVLHHQQVSDTISQPSFTTAIRFPIQCSGRSYGILYIASDPVHPTDSILPLEIAHQLAQTCSFLLYNLEVTAFIQEPCQRLVYQVHAPLTKQERKVLGLMWRKYNFDEIAAQLAIERTTVGTHCKNIYSKLGVSSERDAILAAYQADLLPLLSDR